MSPTPVRPTLLIPMIIAAIGLAATPVVAQDATAVAAVSTDPQTPTTPDASSPGRTVRTLQAALLEAMMRADELGFEGRYELLLPVVGETFDVSFMGSKSVGRHWKKLSAEEQASWLAKFSGYLTANFAGNFDGYDGESFEVVGEQPAARDTRVVLTRLKIPGNEDVVLNYRLRQAKTGEWRIIDIYLKGTVSELALRRSDFSATLKEKGFSELTLAVEKKIADLRKKGGS